MTIRPLTTADAGNYCELRREMLLDSPWAFGSSPGHDRMGDARAVEEWIGSGAGVIVAAIDDGSGRPVSVAGAMRESGPKRAHIAVVWGVYTAPAFRCRGLGRAVVSAAVDAARAWPGIEQVQLSVSENSAPARALYESLGFVVWGVEPDCLRVGGRGFAEAHMALRW